MFEKPAPTTVTTIDTARAVGVADDSFDGCHTLAGPATPRMLRTGGQEMEIEPLGREITRCPSTESIINHLC